MNKNELDTDLSKDEQLQVTFWLSDEKEKNKLKETAKANGMSMSALIRYLIIKEWRTLKKEAHNGN